MEQFRRSMRGAPENIADQIKSTSEDVAHFVTEPFQEVAYNQPTAFAFALGVFTGAGLVIISRILPL